MSKLESLLSRRGALLADGAFGTNLFDMGLVSGDAPELWNTDEPEKSRPCTGPSFKLALISF